MDSRFQNYLATLPKSTGTTCCQHKSKPTIEVYEKIVRLKMRAEDGKMRETDCLDTQDLIQSIPSPKAEPFKMWLAEMVMSGCRRYLILSKVWTGKTGRKQEEAKNGFSIVCRVRKRGTN